MGANAYKYGKVLGNVYVEYFLSGLLVVGATVAIAWPGNSSISELVLASGLSLQLLSLVFYTYAVIDEYWKWEDDFVKRLLIQAAMGSIVPYMMVVGMNYIGSFIFGKHVIEPLYSKHFIAVSILIGVVFNVCVAIYLYLSKAFGSQNNGVSNEYERATFTHAFPQYIWAKNGLDNFKLKLSEVFYFQIIDKVMLIYYSDNEVYSVRKSLKYLQSTLDPDRFMQINRSIIISRKAFCSYKNREDGGLDVCLNYNKKETQVSVSCEKAQAIINWINGQSVLKQGNSEYKKLLIPCL